MRDYDLIVIGSGPAGEKGAAQAAWSGRRVALIERDPAPGGASVNTGTIPSKTLRESALHLSGLRQRGFRDVGRADGILLAELQTRLGVTLHLGAEIDSPADLPVQKMLYAAGRTANTSSLDLDAAGVITGKRGEILVNEHYQTSVPHIYAAGDVIGFPALASTSMEQARVAMVHAFDLHYKTEVARTLPYAIYTIPELATIGMTEQPGTAVGRAFYRANARGRIVGDTTGMIKLVFDPETLRLLGVHIIGENAAELLHTGMMVMQFGGTIKAFIDAVFNFPTLSETYKYAAYDGLANVDRRPLAGRSAGCQPAVSSPA